LIKKTAKNLNGSLEKRNCGKMPQNERQRVWKGELNKTTGGLKKKDLIRNSRGKIVSKKKSEAAKKNNENNLAGWLRKKGENFLSKGVTVEHVVRKEKRKKKLEKLTLPGAQKKKLDSKKTVVVLPKPKPKPKQPVAPKPKPKQPVAPKPKPKPKPKPVVKKKKKKAPVIVNEAPEEAGEVPNLSEITIGNMSKEIDFNTEAGKYIFRARIWKQKGADQKRVEKKFGPLPNGVTWDSI
jgi:hypothetical protein